MTPATLYALIAILATLFYGLGCFAIFGEVSLPLTHRWHQHWFNIAGAATGWIAGWPVFNQWFVIGAPPTVATILLLLIAFIGVTGHLPVFFMASRWRQPSNGRAWPPERP